MNANRKRLLLLTLLAATLAWPVRAQDGPLAVEDEALTLPPPPESSEPPAVDLTLLAELRGARANAGTLPIAPVVVPRELAAAAPVVGGILQDVGRKAGGRRLLESMLFDQLRRTLPGSEGYLLEQATIPEFLNPPAEGWTVQFDFRLPQTGIGRAVYTASLRDGRTGDVQRFSGTVSIDREATGVTVTRVVRRGETLRAEDVQALTSRLSRLPRGTLDDVELTLGTKARKELRPGEWLTDQVVNLPDMVRRGQAVTMRLVHGPLTITAPGVVQQSGRRGEAVRVQNAQSKKEIFAKVVSKDEVQVIN